MKYKRYYNEDSSPAKIIVCKCEQCKATKRSRSNRKVSKYVKRMLNKKSRSLNDSYFVYCWA